MATVLRLRGGKRHLWRLLSLISLNRRSVSHWRRWWRVAMLHSLRTFVSIGHVRYINILTWLRAFLVKLLYLVLFVSLYLSLFWELEDKRNLKNLQFWPESLGAMLEYWYIELGLLFLRILTAHLTAVKRKSMRNTLVPGRRPRKFPAPKFNWNHCRTGVTRKKIERQWWIC